MAGLCGQEKGLFSHPSRIGGAFVRLKAEWKVPKIPEGSESSRPFSCSKNRLGFCFF